MEAEGSTPNIPRPARLAGELLVRSSLFFAFWLLLVDETDEPNMLTGAVVAVVAAALTALLRALRPVRLAPRPHMLRHLHRPFVLLVTDTLRVMGALAQRLRGQPVHGRIRAAHYAACAGTGTDAAQRVLTEWAASLGSNRYVIGIDADRGLLIIHELADASGPLDPLELG